MAPGEALDEIRELMNRSTRSYLCGWSSLLCGLIALAGGLLVDALLKAANDFAGGPGAPIALALVFVVALATLVLGILVPFVFSLIRARKQGIKLSFNVNNRRMFVALFLPVFIGGVICIAMCCAPNDMDEWIPAVMLCFYGLAVFNLSKCNETTMSWPGLVIIIIGLAACFLREYALTLWIIGFGGVHIVYGVYLIFKNRV